MTVTQLLILRALSISGTVTYSDLESVFPHLTATKGDTKRPLAWLAEKGYLLETGVPSKPFMYEISNKGKRHLKKLDAVDGEMPAKREPAVYVPYKPSPIVTRRGSEDFLKCPSLRGEIRVAHRPPFALSGT